jgi:glutamate-1-semialdehyde aminotransferase
MDNQPLATVSAPVYAASYGENNIPLRLSTQSVIGASVTVANGGTLIWRREEPAGKNVDLVVCWDGEVVATHHLSRPVVMPGESVTLHFPLAAPAGAGSHEFTLDLVQQNVTRFSERGAETLRLSIDVDDTRPSRSAALLARARSLSPWYYQATQGVLESRDGRGFPHFVSKAEGCHLWDLEGRQYIDYTIGWGCALLGYAEPRVQRAIAEMLDSAAIVPFPYELEIEVAGMLTEDIPCAEMVMFGKNGSDVCTLAARVSRAFTGKRKILFCGYHGWQDWWVEQFGFAATGVPDRQEQLLHRFVFNDIAGFTRLWEEHRSDLAAVIMEPAGPSQGSQGPSPDADTQYLSEVACMAREAGALLVFDEIITGFRYPGGGVQKATGVVPDLACFGKALSNGMPLSALVGRAEVLKRSMGQTHYGPTFRGEMYSLAAARATMEIYRTEPVAETVWSLGRVLQDGINGSCRFHGVAANCEGPPFRFTLAFAEDDPMRLALKRTLLQQELLKAGLITYNGFLLPSYAHRGRTVIDATLAAVDAALVTIAEAERRNRLDRRLEIPLLTS